MAIQNNQKRNPIHTPFTTRHITRRVKEHRGLAIALGVFIVIAITIALFYKNTALRAATFTWVQDAWTGGADTNTAPGQSGMAVHPGNQTGWTKYDAKDANVTASTTVSLGGAGTVTKTDTTLADFTAGTQSSTTTVGSSGAGGVKLTQSAIDPPVNTPFTYTHGTQYGMRHNQIFDTVSNAIWVVRNTGSTMVEKIPMDGSTPTAYNYAGISILSMAFDTLSNTIFMVRSDTKIQEVNPATGAVINTLSPAAGANADIVYDSAHNLLFYNSSSYRIQKINPDGTSPATCYTGNANVSPFALLLDSTNTYIFATAYGYSSNLLLRFTLPGCTNGNSNFDGIPNQFDDWTYDSGTSSLWLTDNADAQIYKVNVSTMLIANIFTNITSPRGIQYDSTQNVLWVNDLSGWPKLKRVSTADGSVQKSYDLPANENPLQLFFEGTTNTLWQLDANGTYITSKWSLTGFAASGTFTSHVIDTSSNATLGNLTYSAATPTNTAVALKVRSSTQADMSGATAWGSCTSVASGQAMSTGGCVTNGHRYVQYQATLTTSDQTVSPELDEVNVSYSGAYTPTSQLQTTDTDFNAGTKTNTAVVGTGTAAYAEASSSETNGTEITSMTGLYIKGQIYDPGTDDTWQFGYSNTAAKYWQLMGYAGDGTSGTAQYTIDLSSYFTNNSYYAGPAIDPTTGYAWVMGIAPTTNYLRFVIVNLSTQSVVYTYTTSIACGMPQAIQYDPSTDAMWSWAVCGQGRVIKTTRSYSSTFITLTTSTLPNYGQNSFVADTLPNGFVYWTNANGNVLWKQPKDGSAATSISLTGNTNSGYQDLTYDPVNNAIWTLNSDASLQANGRILKIASDNSITAYTTGLTTSGTYAAIVYDSYHQRLIAEGVSSNTLYFINPANGAVLSSTTNSSTNTYIMYFDPVHRTLWGGNSNNWVMRYASYQTSGSFTSAILDSISNTQYLAVSFTALTYTGTTIKVKVRSSNSATMTGATAWSSCTAVTSGQQIRNSGCVSDGDRYFQYNIDFTGTAASSARLLDITVNYAQYASGTLTSSPFDTNDSSNVLSKIQWSASGGGTIQFQLRTSADGSTWTSWLGPTSSSDYYTDSAGGQAINSANHDGIGDRYIQYKAFLSASASGSPTLSSVTATYVVNAPPEIQATPTATQNANGTVTISYAVRDQDSSTDTGSIGLVTPSFEYSLDNGAHWSTISSGLPADAITPKAVNTGSPLTYTTYATTWTPKTALNGTYAAQAKIRVTVNDQQGANNTAQASTSAFALDLKNPTPGASPILVDASTSPATITLSASDDSALQMCVTLDDTQNNCVPYSTNRTIALATDPDTVYVIFVDAFGNTASANAVTPPTPANLVIRDISNPPTNEYQIFTTWAASSLPSNQFQKYSLYHSTDGSSYSLLTTMSDKTYNYYLHKNLSSGTTHYYKVTTTDAAGNISYFSPTINGTANGQGGGTDVVPPIISNVAIGSITTQSAVVTWDTDELSNSTVGYSTTGGQFNTEVGVATMLDHAGAAGHHQVILTNLTPNTHYYLRIKSSDPSGNAAYDSNGGAGYALQTLAGPVISGVTTSSIDNTAATINWHTDISADSTVIYSTNANMASPTTLNDSHQVTDHALNLTGLTLGTKYYYEVQSGVALDPNGGQYYTFTTTQDSTGPVISNITVAPITDTQAVVTWTTNERATSQVSYGTTSGSHPTQTALDANLNIEHSVTLTSLVAHTTYYFVISSNDASNNGTVSSESSFQTTYTLVEQTPDTIPPVISNRQVAPITDTQAVVQWTTDEGATSRVDYGTSSGHLNSHVGPDATLNLTHFLTLPSLTANTQYFYTVTSVDKWNNTITSSEQSFTTLHTLVEETPSVTPPVISNIAIDPVTDTSLVIRWLTDVPASSQVAYGLASGSHGTTTPLVNTLDLNHAVTITGLTAHTTYYFVVTSTDRWNNHASSSEQNVTTHYQLVEQTPSSNLPVISNIVAAPILDTQAVIQWTTDVRSTARVDYGSTSGQLTSHLGPDGVNNITHAVTLPHLTAYTTYYFTVTSVDEWGNSSTSGEQHFTTVHTLVEQTPTTQPPTLSAITIEPISDTTAVIHWVTDVAATSQVSYGTQAGSYPLTSIIDLSRNLTHSVTITSLQPSTVYHFVVTSSDQWDNTATSSDQKFTTKELLVPNSQVQSQIDAIKNAHPNDTTPPELTGISVVNLTPNGASIVWTSNEAANSFVQFGPTSSDQLVYGNWVYDTSHQIALQSLQPNTTYTYRVVSADLAGNTTQSPSLNFTTPALAPSALESQLQQQVQQIQQQAQTIPGPVIGGQPKVDVTNTTATISWTTDKPANSLIKYATDTEFSAQKAYTQSVGDPENFVTTHSVKIGNLLENTVYHFQIISSTQVGQTTTTADATFQTPKRIFAIENYSVDTPDTQTAIFRWTTNDPSTATVQITPYRNNVLAVDELKTLADTSTSLIHQVTASTLEPGTRYKVQLMSTNDAKAQADKVIDAFSTASSGQPPVISQIKIDSALSPGAKVKVQTIVSWTTDSPSTSQVWWRQGVGKADEVLTSSTPLDAAYAKHHVVVITTFDPGTVYQLRVESKNSNGQVATSKALTTLTPQQEQTVFQVITNTFTQVFGWTQIFGH